jgi:NAD(P)-dependent dehydrogenase (short-subunit alcohol dehydrogenase family)
VTDYYIASLGETSEEHAGTIINVTSHVGLLEMPTSSAYAISKLAVIKLNEMIAAGKFENFHPITYIMMLTRFTEHSSIRAVSVHPGIVPTALSSLGKLALDSVELAGHFNLWLASPRAAFLQGRYVTANWHVDELEAHKDEILSENLLRLQLAATYGDDGHFWKK